MINAIGVSVTMRTGQIAIVGQSKTDCKAIAGGISSGVRCLIFRHKATERMSRSEQPNNARLYIVHSLLVNTSFVKSRCYAIVLPAVLI